MLTGHSAHPQHPPSFPPSLLHTPLHTVARTTHPHTQQKQTVHEALRQRKPGSVQDNQTVYLSITQVIKAPVYTDPPRLPKCLAPKKLSKALAAAINNKYSGGRLFSTPAEGHNHNNNTTAVVDTRYTQVERDWTTSYCCCGFCVCFCVYVLYVFLHSLHTL